MICAILGTQKSERKFQSYWLKEQDDKNLGPLHVLESKVRNPEEERD